MNISMELTGVDAVLLAVATYREKVKKSIRAGVAAGRKVYLSALKNAAPVESGLLKKSLGTRSKTYRKGEVAGQTIGPRSGFKKEVVLKSTRMIAGKRRKVIRKELRDPRKYAHITEKRNPWIRPTFEAVTGAALQTTLQTIGAGL